MDAELVIYMTFSAAYLTVYTGFITYIIIKLKSQLDNFMKMILLFDFIGLFCNHSLFIKSLVQLTLWGVIVSPYCCER